MLVDHLVPGSKESRLAAQVVSPHVLVVGHPYVDVWQAVRPAVAGHRRLAGGPARHAVEGGRLRRSRLAGRHRPRPGAGSSARSRPYADLEPSLLGRVEELIDFVTGPGVHP